mmetsp:Transcript_20608/g.38422  ORF Transcript_20608/g.38422 Transcript_20608/m.38422 type:complete len:241 (+) Transcript_20608:26-748(+)
MPDSSRLLVLSILFILQFPIVFLYLIAHPLIFYGSFKCFDSDAACSGCHASPMGWVPLSLSGVIADNISLQATLILSLILFFLSFEFSTSTSPKYSFTAVFSMFLCLFVFPIRYGCEQTYFNVCTHLTCLCLTLGFSCLTFRTRKHHFDSAFTDAFFLNSALAVASSTASIIWTEEERFGWIFVGTEVGMVLIATAWAILKVAASDMENKGSSSSSSSKSISKSSRRSNSRRIRGRKKSD